MRRTASGLLALSFASVMLLSTAPASATTLDFEGIGTPAECDVNTHLFTTNYGGFIWSNWLIECGAFYYGQVDGWGNTEANIPFPSPGWAVESYYTGPATISRPGQPFDFLGAWFATFSVNDYYATFGADRLTIDGYNGATHVGQLNMSNTPALNLTPAFQLSGGLKGVDRLVFTYRDVNLWLMDDFSFSEPAVEQPVIPEPASLLLLGTGLSGLLARRHAPREGRGPVEPPSS